MLNLKIDRTTNTDVTEGTRPQRIVTLTFEHPAIYTARFDDVDACDAELNLIIARELRREADALSLETVPEAESRIIDAAMKLYQGSVAKAARAIGIGRATLYRRLK